LYIGVAQETQKQWQTQLQTESGKKAARLQIDKNQVNVKATTEEGLGFTGQGQGISSQAICLLETIDNFDYRSSRVVDDTVENAANPCMGCMGCAKR
jgi:2-C-methyl-D-erythritol 2,4-cyclodiphosphate synthase